MTPKKPGKKRALPSVSAPRQTAPPPGGQPADTPDERQTARAPRPRSEGQRLLVGVPASLGEVANKVGCGSRQTVADWRSGTKVPGAAFRHRLHQEYGIRPEAWDEKPLGARSTRPPPAPRMPREATTTLEQVIELIEGVRRDLDNPGLLATERMKLRETMARLLSTRHRLETADQMLDDRIVRQHPVWKRFKSTMLEALAPYPEASRAVLEALAKVGE